MRATMRACLMQLAAWAFLAAIAYVYLVRSPGLAIAIGLCGCLVAGFVMGIATAARERRMLLRGTAAPLPQDDAWLAVSGEIRAASPLPAPLSGERVVAYEYRIWADKPMGRRQGTTPVTYYDGKALAASSIATAHGAIRLLAVPSLEVFPADLANAVARAQDYLRTATFAPRDTGKQRTDALEHEWEDDDGVFRIDKRHVTDDVDLAGRVHFEERHLRQGERICAFGYYSAARRGLVPDPKWGRQTRVMRGAPVTVAAALSRRMAWYAFWSIAFAAAGAAIVIYNAR